MTSSCVRERHSEAHVWRRSGLRARFIYGRLLVVPYPGVTWKLDFLTFWIITELQRKTAIRAEYTCVGQVCGVYSWDRVCSSSSVSQIRSRCNCKILYFYASHSGSHYYFLFICGAGVEPSPLLLRPFISLLYQPWMIDDDCGAISGMNEWQGKPKYSEKICPSAALSTTHPTWLDMGINPDRRRGKPATKRLSYGTANSGSCLALVWTFLLLIQYISQPVKIRNYVSYSICKSVKSGRGIS
jgi:hypothetical protein